MYEIPKYWYIIFFLLLNRYDMHPWPMIFGMICRSALPNTDTVRSSYNNKNNNKKNINWSQNLTNAWGSGEEIAQLKTKKLPLFAQNIVTNIFVRKEDQDRSSNNSD